MGRKKFEVVKGDKVLVDSIGQVGTFLKVYTAHKTNGSKRSVCGVLIENKAMNLRAASRAEVH